MVSPVRRLTVLAGFLAAITLAPTPLATPPAQAAPVAPAAVGAAPAAPATPKAAPDVSITATQRSVRCAQAGHAAGWRGSTLVTAVAVSLAESDCTAGAQHPNPPSSACPNGSLDRGAWQINDCHQSWVSNSCAYELYCNARAAHTIHGWSGWGAWTTYNTGAYRGYLSEAQAGVDAIGGGGGVVGTVNTGTGTQVLYVRSGPSSSYNVVGSLANGTRITIQCQTRGQWVYSDVYRVWTDLWDRVGSGRFVSDAYVHTGSDGQVAPNC